MAVAGLRWEQIRKAININGIRYPADFDIDNADFAGKDIYGSDFSLLGTRPTGYEPVIFEKDRRLSGYEPILVEK